MFLLKSLHSFHPPCLSSLSHFPHRVECTSRRWTLSMKRSCLSTRCATSAPSCECRPAVLGQGGREAERNYVYNCLLWYLLCDVMLCCLASYSSLCCSWRECVSWFAHDIDTPIVVFMISYVWKACHSIFRQSSLSHTQHIVIILLIGVVTAMHITAWPSALHPNCHTQSTSGTLFSP